MNPVPIIVAIWDCPPVMYLRYIGYAEKICNSEKCRGCPTCLRGAC